MRNKEIRNWLAIMAAVGAAAISYVFQRFALSQLEENYIFLYDWQHILRELEHCGGVAMLLASFCTQWMHWLWAGPLCVGLICGFLILCLVRVMSYFKPQPWTYALTLFPIAFLLLCLENNSFKFQGFIALCLVLPALWGYAAASKRIRTAWPPLISCVGTVALYWATGSAAMLFVFGAILLECRLSARGAFLSLLSAAVFAGCAFWSHYLGMTSTLQRAFTPGMYYEWDTTWFMLLYAWIAIASCLLCALVFTASNATSLRGWQLAGFIAVCAAAIGVGCKFYSLVHSASVQRTMQQRYYAKLGDWDAILNMDYGQERTPFTSYRFLAMAKKGELADNLQSTYPYIGYFMENKTLVKKEDLEVLSDIFYECRSMGAARRYAFDTDMVTPGEFNPVETIKLAEINIAYGDYAVAEKLIAQLEKTLLYSRKAKELRNFLYKDETVAADAALGSMRRAIPKENSYMTPKGTGRDLLYAAEANPDNCAAKEFYRTFQILTQGHE